MWPRFNEFSQMASVGVEMATTAKVCTQSRPVMEFMLTYFHLKALRNRQWLMPTPD